MEASGAEQQFNRALGARLRAARRNRGLSLARVEQLTDSEFKASVVGAYERGERALSVHRLYGLARVYGVPVTDLLPEDPSGPEVVIDVDALPADDIVSKFLSAIQVMRNPDGGAMAVRQGDLAVLSALVGNTVDAALES